MASTAYSAQYRASCPTCKAESFMPCRTLKTKRVTDTHAGRVRLARAARVIPAPLPDPPVSYNRFFPVQRENTSQQAVDTLRELGYSRSIALALLSDN